MRDPAMYQKIQSFQFDEGQVKFRFVDRLARENGWTLAFAERVLDEYRRFAYLAATGTHPMTPSDEVDQAWHLHMLYTESYFDRFCGEILGKRLSHGPTKGGKAEGDKFVDWYAKTREAYFEEFGERPPEEIWPAAEVRFGKGKEMVRVDRTQVWILDKSRVRRAMSYSALCVFGLAAIGCVATASASGGADMNLFMLIGGGSIAFIGLIVFLVRRFGSGGHGSGTSGCGTSGYMYGGGHTGSHNHHEDGRDSVDGGGSDHGGDSGGSSDSGSSGCGSSGCGGGCGGGGD